MWKKTVQVYKCLYMSKQHRKKGIKMPTGVREVTQLNETSPVEKIICLKYYQTLFLLNYEEKHLM